MGCNAVACYALMDLPEYEESIRTNLRMAWNAKPMTGQYRYYDGLVHYMAMLHLCGSFRIWKPEEDIPAAVSDIERRAGQVASDRWYTLDGRPLKGKPTQRGVYVKRGKKLTIEH